MYVVRWYKTDTNHVPAQSVLQPIDSILKQFLNKKDPTLQETTSQNLYCCTQCLILSKTLSPREVG